MAEATDTTGTGWQANGKRLLRGARRILPRPRLNRTQMLAAMLLGLLGFSLVVQARQTQSANLTTLSQSELVQLLDDVTGRSERLDGEAQDLQRTSEELRSGSDKAAAAERATRDRLNVLGILAGTLAAEGEGITLTITDPNEAVDAAQLLDTVQELRDAGAEAIQVGNVRVVAGTSFIDAEPAAGGGVIVDGTTLHAPFAFSAIGDPPTLETALDIPGGVLESLRGNGAHGTVRSVDELTVTALHTVRPPEFAVPNSGN